MVFPRFFSIFAKSSKYQHYGPFKAQPAPLLRQDHRNRQRPLHCWAHAGIWRKYVYPVYPVSYETFMRIVSYPRLQQELDELEAERESGALRPRVSEIRKPELWERNQLSLEFAE